MLKKISLLIISSIIIFSSFIWTNIALENCDYSADWELVELLSDCIDESGGTTFWWVIPEGDLDLWTWDWFSQLISKFVINISKLLFILAVWALVYASYLLVLSGWEDEKIKKAKDIIKWTIIWFIWLISAWLIIMLIVKMWYFVWT